MSEEFAFHEVLGQCSAVHSHERHVGSVADFVNAAGDEFFSSSRFTEDQDIGVGRADLLDQRLHAVHRLRFADDVGRAADRFQFRLQGQRAVPQPVLLDDAVHGGRDGRQVRGLGDEVEGTQVQGLDDFRHAAVSGRDDEIGIGRDLFQVLDHAPTVDIGHLQVDDRTIKILLIEERIGSCAVLSDGDFVSLLLQFVLDDQTESGLIIREQDAK